MKKILICAIPMTTNDKVIYENGLSKENISVEPFYYPINAYLAENMTAEDEWKVILLVKRDREGRELVTEQLFHEELAKVNKKIGAKITCKTISTKFEAIKRVHDHILGALVEEIDDESEIYVDNTYAPKELSVIIFAALNFSEKFLDCEIEHIFYLQEASCKLVTMDALFSLQSLVSKAHSDSSEKARHLLKMIISL